MKVDSDAEQQGSWGQGHVGGRGRPVGVEWSCFLRSGSISPPPSPAIPRLSCRGLTWFGGRRGVLGKDWEEHAFHSVRVKMKLEDQQQLPCGASPRAAPRLQDSLPGPGTMGVSLWLIHPGSRPQESRLNQQCCLFPLYPCFSLPELPELL